MELFHPTLSNGGERYAKYLIKSLGPYTTHYLSFILQGAEVPFYIWYDDYPEHASPEYKGRVSKVKPGGQYGEASLILTGVNNTDRGWYNCKVLFLNREPNGAVVNVCCSNTRSVMRKSSLFYLVAEWNLVFCGGRGQAQDQHTSGSCGICQPSRQHSFALHCNWI